MLCLDDQEQLCSRVGYRYQPQLYPLLWIGLRLDLLLCVVCFCCSSRLFLDYPFSVTVVFCAVQETFFSEITDISFDVSLADF